MDLWKKLFSTKDQPWPAAKMQAAEEYKKLHSEATAARHWQGIKSGETFDPRAVFNDIQDMLEGPRRSIMDKYGLSPRDMHDIFLAAEVPSYKGKTGLASGTNTVRPKGFAAKAVQGPADCRVPIVACATLYEQFVAAMEKAGRSVNRVAERVDTELVGVCPQCWRPLGGQGLAFLALSDKLGARAFVSFGDTGGAERLQRGLCSNSACTCQEIHIFWRFREDPDALSRLAAVGLKPT